MEENFRSVKVVLRSAKGDERAWNVEVDVYAPLDGLLPDLVQELNLEGVADEYELHNDGSIAEPVLILMRKERPRVRKIRQVEP